MSTPGIPTAFYKDIDEVSLQSEGSDLSGKTLQHGFCPASRQAGLFLASCYLHAG